LKPRSMTSKYGTVSSAHCAIFQKVSCRQCESSNCWSKFTYKEGKRFTKTVLALCVSDTCKQKRGRNRVVRSVSTLKLEQQMSSSQEKMSSVFGASPRQSSSSSSSSGSGSGAKSG